MFITNCINLLRNIYSNIKFDKHTLNLRINVCILLIQQLYNNTAITTKLLFKNYSNIRHTMFY